MVTEGYLPLDIPSAGKPCQTWYRIYGNLKSSEPGRRPLIILHGGPGVPSNYLSPLAADLWSKCSIPAIIYDQVGCGKSTNLSEKQGDIAFWTSQGLTGLFVYELKTLISHLGIGDDYDLLGHSWGGKLAFDFALAHPQGLKHLVLHSTSTDAATWNSSQKKLLKQQPKAFQKTIEKHERDGTTDSPEFREATSTYLQHAMCRVEWPRELMESFKALQQNRSVHLTIFGSSNLALNGPIKSWTAIPHLSEIKMPTLLLNGRYDSAQDEAVKGFFNGITKVKWVTFEKSAHMSHLEEPEKFIDILGSFLEG